MKDFFRKMLMGVDENPSSKRTITFIAFLLVAVAFLVNIFFEIPIKQFIFEGMLWLTAAGLGFTTLDHFKKK
jgi:hypothetical protein